MIVLDHREKSEIKNMKKRLMEKFYNFKKKISSFSEKFYHF